jgi:predicted amidohydrolase|uniref:Carbon-nitrogen hydrolase family protein n=1 Tax=Desulfobacca acetoxidans TaxID=60893 RepID=A0A7C5AKE0_9BACT
MRIAAVQLNSKADLAGNVARAREYTIKAAQEGAMLVSLPEHFAYLGPEEKWPPSTQTLKGPLFREFSALARELGIFVLLGSFPEKASPDLPPYNTSVLLGRDGNILAVYRKIHLFDVNLPGGPVFKESDFVRPGTEVVAVALPGTPFTAGLAICYDLRFPELFRALVSRGANLLFVPAAFTFATGRDHWEVLLRARAIENQAYVVAPAQWGTHSPGRRSYGRSLIVDPWGTILAQAPDGEGVIYADLDPDRLERLRRDLPCLQHRRLMI